MMLAQPILIPMLGAVLCVLLWPHARARRIVTVLSAAGSLVAALLILWTTSSGEILKLELGGWAAPFGIALVADRFTGIMVTLAAIVGLAVCVSMLAAPERDTTHRATGLLTLCLLAAVAGAFLSGDLFNLYVWFELMLLSSFVLLTLGGSRAQLEGAVKYVTLNLLSSVLFLATVGGIYAVTGTLNMAHLAQRLDALDDPALTTLLAAPLLAAFAIKAAVFPAYFWLPASYHTPSPLVSALFAGLLTKVGVYSLIRATTLMFDQERALLGDAVLLIAGLTMLSGVLGAVSHNDMRRILSFHIVSQIGYMLMGLGIALRVDDPTIAALALAGAVFYITHHIVVKTNLFLISGAVLNATGTTELNKLSGVMRTHPYLAALFLVSALSLAGIPILSGFWAKVVLVRSGLEAGAYAIVVVSLVVSIFTLFSMIKIWVQGFWGEPNGQADGHVAPARASVLLGPVIGMAVLTLSIGIGGGAVFRFAATTAEQLLDSEMYIRAVLPEAPDAGEDGGTP